MLEAIQIWIGGEGEALNYLTDLLHSSLSVKK